MDSMWKKMIYYFVEKIMMASLILSVSIGIRAVEDTTPIYSNEICEKVIQDYLKDTQTVFMNDGMDGVYVIDRIYILLDKAPEKIDIEWILSLSIWNYTIYSKETVPQLIKITEKIRIHLGDSSYCLPIKYLYLCFDADLDKDAILTKNIQEYFVYLNFVGIDFRHFGTENTTTNVRSYSPFTNRYEINYTKIVDVKEYLYLLEQLFSNMKSLEALTLTGGFFKCCKLSNIIKYLPNTVEKFYLGSFSINDFRYGDDNHYSGFQGSNLLLGKCDFSCLVHQKEFFLEFTSVKDKENFPQLVANLPESLEKLRIKGGYRYYSRPSNKVLALGLNYIARLKNLKCLILEEISSTPSDWGLLFEGIPTLLDTLIIKKCNYKGERGKNLIQCIDLDTLEISTCCFNDSCAWNGLIRYLPKKLTTVIFTESDYHGESIEEFKSCQNIEILNLYNCLLSEINSSRLFASLPSSLEILNISNIQTKELDVQNLKNFKNLKQFYAAGCFIGGHVSKIIWNDFFCSLPASLEVFEFTMNDYSWEGVERFKELGNLEILNVNTNRFLTRESCKEWTRLLENLNPNLEVLNLSWTKYPGVAAENLKKLTKLVYINFECCKMSQAKWDNVIYNLPDNIEVIVLSGTCCSPDSLQALMKYSNLKKLYISKRMDIKLNFEKIKKELIKRGVEIFYD